MTPVVLQMVIMGTVFIAVVLTVMAVAPVAGRKLNLRERIAGPVLEMPVRGRSRDGMTLRNDNRNSIWARIVVVVEKSGLSLADTKDVQVRARLAQAGYNSPYAPRVYMLARVVLTLGLPLLAFVPLLLTGGASKPGKLYLWISGLALFGLYAPSIYVGHRIDKRREELLNGFPDTLDLMLVCVEAGLGIDACFNRVGREIAKSHPLLAAQFEAVALEMRAGRSREEALKGLAKRSGLPEITAFVTLLVQAQKLGSSIAQALKIYSEEMREARKMRAEEKAHRLPVLLSIPLVVFMLPTMMSVLMLPGVIMVMRNVLPNMH